MEVSPSIIERLASPVRAAALEYVDVWQSLAGGSLQALVFFGRVVSSQYDTRWHLADNAVVLSDVDLYLLRRLAPAGKKFGRRGIAAPIILTPAALRDSLDTFPLELLEIQRQHVLIFGQDLFGELRFEPEHVRLQCERELKTLLIGMRQGLLAAAGREKQLDGLEVSTVENLLRTLRGLLWLKDLAEPDSPEGLIAGVEQMLDRKLIAVRAVVQGTADKGWDQFVALYEDLEILGKKVDAW
jgi:hypothetical protein